MGRWIRSSLAGCLAVLVAPLLVLGVMAGMAPASAASSLSRESGGGTPAGAAGLATVPASLRAAIGQSLGTSVSAAGYSQQAELTASHGAAGEGFGESVALSVPPPPWLGRTFTTRTRAVHDHLKLPAQDRAGRSGEWLELRIKNFER
jgi:hypothetical protein